MKNYRFVMDFYYSNNCYKMYLDDNNKRFFLKVNLKEELSYLTFEELLDLIFNFHSIPIVMNIEKKGEKKCSFVPKIIIGGVAVTLSLALFTTALSMYQSQERLKKFEKNYTSSASDYNEIAANYISTTDSDNNENDTLVVDTYLSSKWLNYKYIYDMEYLGEVLNYNKVTIEEIKKVIENNNSISNEYKDLLYEYCDALFEKYPNIEARVFYENLKTLEVVECTKEELIKHTLNVGSYGCYVRTENKIYVLKDYKYKKGTWAYQVIFHEFSHCLRTGVWNVDGCKVKVQVEGQNFNNTITAEALNSLFTVSLFDYEERDIAYQLQSNYNNIMINCMDNYSLQDYVSHSLGYYAKKLDEYNNDKNYATVILELIQMQYNDYHRESIYVEKEAYYPIYDYIANMYYKKYINSNMSYNDASQITGKLIDLITYDVPEDYYIDTNHFYDYLKEYCQSIGIDVSTKTK